MGNELACCHGDGAIEAPSVQRLLADNRAIARGHVDLRAEAAEMRLRFRVQVLRASNKLLVDADGSSLKKCRASVLAQVEETTGTKLAQEDLAMLFKEPFSDEWMLLSPASLSEMIAGAADQIIDLRIEDRQSCTDPSGPTLSDSTAEFAPLWPMVVKFATILAAGKDQQRCITLLAQIATQAQDNRNFPLVVAIRWRLSEQLLLTEILQCFDSNVGAYMSGGAGTVDLQLLVNASKLIRLLAYKGNENQYQFALRPENWTQIEQSPFIERALQLLRKSKEDCGEEISSAASICQSCIRFLQFDGQTSEASGRVIRKQMIESGFVLHVQQQLQEASEEIQETDSTNASTVTRPRKTSVYGSEEEAGKLAEKLALFADLARDDDNRSELKKPEIINPLFGLLGNLHNSNLDKCNNYICFALIRLLDEDLLDSLAKEMSEVIHFLSGAIEKKIKGKFVFHRLADLLQMIKKLSSSDRGKTHFAPLMSVLIDLLREPFEPLPTRHGSPLAFEEYIDSFPENLECSRSPSTLLSLEVKQLAAEILLSLVFDDINLLTLQGHEEWVFVLQSLGDKELEREVQGILYKLEVRQALKGTSSAAQLAAAAAPFNARRQGSLGRSVASGGASTGASSGVAGGYTRAAALPSSPSHKPVGAKPTRVMISYCWAQQETIKKVYEFLVRQGFDVWLDIHEMATTAPGVLEAMSAAIDGAEVILVCVSREYKDSANCRLEAEYAHVKKKRLHFLMMQEDYTSPSGWLGILVGAALWCPLFSPEPIATKMAQLVLTLRGQGRRDKDDAKAASSSASC
jgi:hypothetical protein